MHDPLPPPPLARPPAILDDSDAFLCKLTAEKTQQTQTIDDDLSRIMTFPNYYIPVNTKNTCFPPAMQSVAQEGEGGGAASLSWCQAVSRGLGSGPRDGF